jgi:hypothetical protein
MDWLSNDSVKWLDYQINWYWFDNLVWFSKKLCLVMTSVSVCDNMWIIKGWIHNNHRNRLTQPNAEKSVRSHVNLVHSLSHPEGDFGVTFNDITKDTSLHVTTSRFVSPRNVRSCGWPRMIFRTLCGNSCWSQPTGRGYIVRGDRPSSSSTVYQDSCHVRGEDTSEGREQ